MNTTMTTSEVIENAGQFTVILPDGCKVLLYGGNQKVNAKLIALAGNLNQKYDLSKLEELVANAETLLGWCEKRGLIYEGAPDDDNVSLALKSIRNSLRSFTRESKPQP